LAPPALLHHLGQAKDYHVQETPDAEREKNDSGVKKPGCGEECV